MNVDYLIVGQGLSGTWLSWFLQKENCRFIVIDKNESITPSKVSAGIINPVTGRRMVKVWMADELLPFAHSVYREIGAFLNVTTISHKNIIDFFPNPHQRQVFLERIEEGEGDLHPYAEQNQFNPFFNYELGCGEIRHCSIVHTEILLPEWQKHLRHNNQLLEEHFELEHLAIGQDTVRYKDIIAGTIIFCDGLSSFQNPFFKQLPFAPNKGEALIVEIPGLPRNHIFKKGFLLAPLQANDQFWLGSNYQWNFPDAEPTIDFLEQAQRHLRSWLKMPFKVLEHKASLRPATLERRPFVGLHPHQQRIGILNGMGTKGCSLAPWFANELVQHLVHQREIDPLAHINRFRKILSL